MCKFTKSEAKTESSRTYKQCSIVIYVSVRVEWVFSVWIISSGNVDWHCGLSDSTWTRVLVWDSNYKTVKNIISQVLSVIVSNSWRATPTDESIHRVTDSFWTQQSTNQSPAKQSLLFPLRWRAVESLRFVLEFAGLKITRRSEDKHNYCVCIRLLKQSTFDCLIMHVQTRK